MQSERDVTDRLYLHAPCHPKGRLVCYLDTDDCLTVACATCEEPVVVLNFWMAQGYVPDAPRLEPSIASL